MSAPMQAAQIDLAPPDLIAKYEPVIGLEIHCQLATRTKIFCGCAAGFGADPNTNRLPSLPRQGPSPARCRSSTAKPLNLPSRHLSRSTAP